jgi:hypothetical protein
MYHKFKVGSLLTLIHGPMVEATTFLVIRTLRGYYEILEDDKPQMWHQSTVDEDFELIQ